MTDHRIFAKLTQHWENEFHEDMKALNVCVQLKSRIVCTWGIHSWVSINALDLPSIDRPWTSISISPSILSLTVDWHLSQKSVDSIHVHVHCQLSTNRWLSRWPSINQDFSQVSIEMSMECQWRVNQGHWSILKHRCIYYTLLQVHSEHLHACWVFIQSSPRYISDHPSIIM